MVDARARLIAMGLLFGTCAAQTAPEPLELVARGEKACAGEDKELGIVLLWEALDRLTPDADNPGNATGITTALALLKANDPREPDRLAAFLAVARPHTDMAALYRGKKWFDTAAERLDFAEGFDRAATARERQQLMKSKGSGPATASSPRVALLRKASTARVTGPWKEQGETLTCDGNSANVPRHEWVIDAQHEDCDVSVEFRCSDDKIGHDASIAVGLDGNSCSYEVIAEYYPKFGTYAFGIWERSESGSKPLAHSNPAPAVSPDGFHRMTVRVRGRSVSAWLDTSPALETKTSVVPRGRFALCVGVTDQNSPPITFRNLRRRPLPREATGDDVVAQAEAQRKVGRALSLASTMMAEKRFEAAAAMLRDAMLDARSLPVGLLRENSLKGLDALLAKADALSMRNEQTAQNSAKALLALADSYAAARQVRAAERLVIKAAEIDPDGCAPRLQAAKNAVAEWQNTQGK